MSEYLVAPAGHHQFARWECIRDVTCGAHGKPGLTGEQAREQGAAHVRETGHTVRVERGSVEWLDGMAQALPPRPELMPG